MDKIDGPYYFFKLIQRLRPRCRRGCPLVGLEGGQINIVPVDFVAAAMDHIAHPDGARRPHVPPHRSRARSRPARC